MGAKNWMLVYAQDDARQLLSAKPVLDRVASAALAKSLFSKDKLEALPDTSLVGACPPSNELCVGCFAGLAVLAAEEFAGDYPSKLAQSFIAHSRPGTLYLHAMHSTVDWFAFAVWRDGVLKRSLSLSPDSGIVEEVGERLAFETPYWAGEHPAVSEEDQEPDEPPYPFPFHPLELGEAALAEFFGYQLEGLAETGLLDPDSVPLMRFKRKKSLFKFW